MHESVNPLIAAITSAELCKTCHWPSLQRDVVTWYMPCTYCKLSKAKRKFSKISDGRDQQVATMVLVGNILLRHVDYKPLEMIDLDTLNVDISTSKTREATNVEASIEDNLGDSELMRADDASKGGLTAHTHVDVLMQS